MTLSSPWNFVRKRIESAWGAKRVNRTYADATLACPHKRISHTDVNHRSSYDPDTGTRNAVAGRLFSAATLRNRSSSNHESKKHTAAGFPPKGRSVNTSRWNTGMRIRSIVTGSALCNILQLLITRLSTSETTCIVFELVLHDVKKPKIRDYTRLHLLDNLIVRFAFSYPFGDSAHLSHFDSSGG
jgi:hypothetical protein